MLFVSCLIIPQYINFFLIKPNLKQLFFYFFLKFIFITFAALLIPKHYTMENQTKKVTSIQGAGTYEGKHGILYSFDYSFDDETTIRANHKTTAPPFSVGDEVDVIIRGSRDGFSWGQVKRPENLAYSSKPTSVDKFQDRQDIILNEWSIGRALEWEMNKSHPHETSIKEAIALAKQLKKYALDLDNISFEKTLEESNTNSTF